jgi:hypothetical protein
MVWLDDHEDEFKRFKAILASDHVIKPFDPFLDMELLTDALAFIEWVCPNSAGIKWAPMLNPVQKVFPL